MAVVTGSAVGAGNVRRESEAVIAERVARIIAALPKGMKRAVCIDPRGRVTVEPVYVENEPDRIGIYVSERVGAWVELAALIEQDLKTCPGVAKRRAA